MIIEQMTNGDRTTIHIFTRDKNGKRQHKIVTDFKPYFYIKEDEPVNLKDYPQITKIEKGNFVSLFGEKLKKIYVRTPGDVLQIRDSFYKTFEADVLFTTRYMIDEIEEIPNHPLRIQFMDIETGSLDIINTPRPIYSIAIYDNFLKKNIVFILNNGSNQKIKNFPNTSIYTFSREEDLLNKFLFFIEDTDPDLITGWFVEGYDLPYIINRMKKLKIDFTKLSPLRYVQIRGEDVVIKGRIVFDMMKGYIHLHEGELVSRALEYVARDELNLGKIPIIDLPDKVWKEDINKFIEYNLRDVELVRKINNKLKIIDFFDETRRFVKCHFLDGFFASNIFDCFILNYCKKHNIILPSKQKVERKRIKGAIVKEPKRGIHKNIAVIDLKSLYPTIMINMNLSPETVDENGEIVIGNGVRLTNKRKGLIPILLEMLIDYRGKIKKKMFKALKEKGIESEEYRAYYQQQFVTKAVTNAFYGQMLFPRCRLYKPEIGDSVTFIGRNIITWTIEQVEKLGYEVIYGDTDSCFVNLNNTNYDEFKKDVEKINRSYSEFTKKFGVDLSAFKVEFEKVYKTFIIFTKKRYAGHLVWKDGQKVDSIDVVGIEVRRSDSSRVTRIIQKEVLSMILKGEGKEKIKMYLKKEINKIKNGEYDLDDIAIPRALRMNIGDYKTDHIILRGCRYSNKYLHTNFKKGDKPKVLHIKNVPKGFPPTDVICIDHRTKVPEGFIVDYDLMIQKILQMKLESIFEAVGWSVDEMLGGQKSLLGF